MGDFLGVKITGAGTLDLGKVLFAFLDGKGVDRIEVKILLDGTEVVTAEAQRVLVLLGEEHEGGRGSVAGAVVTAVECRGERGELLVLTLRHTHLESNFLDNGLSGFFYYGSFHRGHFALPLFGGSLVVTVNILDAITKIKSVAKIKAVLPSDSNSSG